MTREWMPLVDANYDRDLTLSADVCVIGTGAGGAVLASELAEAGRKVVMLEKGGYHTRKDFDQTERTMMPMLFEEGGARTTTDGGIQILHGRCVGGSTTINWAICFDPPPEVTARWEAEHGIPGLRPADLAPSLAKVRRILNVQRLRDDEINPNSQLLLDGAQQLGLAADRFEHNRTACLQSGFCILGCAYDRKQSMLVTYVPRAIHFGARLVPDAEATTLEVRGDRITAVEGTLTNRKTGGRHRFRIEAELVAVAGGAISTPVLLKKNRIRDDSGMLGRNLRLHPTAAAVGAFPDAVNGSQGIQYGTYVSALERDGVIIEAVFAYPGLMGANLFRWGAPAMALMQRYDDLAAAIVLLHDHASGRVDVDGKGCPAISYELAAGDAGRFREGLKMVARIYLAKGAERVYMPHIAGLSIAREADLDRIDRMAIAPDQFALFSAHQMGTAAMGADPRRSVTDPWGRLHAYRNLYICDGSLFPTAVGVNPQLTIATLADRTARHLAAKG